MVMCQKRSLSIQTKGTLRGHPFSHCFQRTMVRIGLLDTISVSTARELLFALQSHKMMISMRIA